MCGGGSALKSLAPIALAIAGNAFLPGIGGVLGDALGAFGGAGASALGGAAGEALAGGSVKQDLEAGAGAGLTAGLGSAFSSAFPETAASISGGIGDAESSVGRAFGLTGGDAGATAVGEGTTGEFASDIANPTAISSGSAGTTGAAGAGSSAGTFLDTSISDSPLPVGQAIDTTGGGLTQAAAAGASPAVPIPSGGFLGSTAATPTSSLLSAATNGTAAPAAASGSGIGGSALNFLSKNAVPLLATGANVIEGNKQAKGTNELLSAGASAQNAAAGLVNSEATGVLPPGQQQAVQQGLQSAIASIKSQYASMGLSGSSMEAQAIEAAQTNAQAQTAQLAQQATTTGLSALNISDSVYNNIVQSILGQDKTLTSAIAGIAGTSGKQGGLAA